jgi:alkanesulfonate monooxygenase SsuD/methylene tetrahydromethanopterin reductase-like flavin-dependent oxidoreductase (luciferase family)
MEFVARHRYAYMGIPYFHFDVFKRYFSMFRNACEAEGYEADPMQYGWLLPIYVAETDEQARREYEEHLWYFVKRLLPGITIQPPGYTSVRSLGSILKSAGTFMLNLETWDEVVDGRYAIVGSPDTVTELLVDSLRQLGTGNLLGLFQLGSLPADLTRKNMTLFAEQVMPRLHAEFPPGERVYRPSQAAA